MTLETIKTLLNRRPFEPLRVKTTHGDVFEITHPEMAFITKGALIVALPDPEGVSDKIEFISYLHITNIETASGNVLR